MDLLYRYFTCQEYSVPFSFFFYIKNTRFLVSHAKQNTTLYQFCILCHSSEVRCFLYFFLKLPFSPSFRSLGFEENRIHCRKNGSSTLTQAHCQLKSLRVILNDMICSERHHFFNIDTQVCCICALNHDSMCCIIHWQLTFSSG